jgi:CubicO group peptidase (beta-lactamase class C family)
MALQEPVQAALDALIASGKEAGLQVTVLHGGHVVADAVAGIADPSTGAPVEPGTLFFATSAGKGVASSVAHVVAENGELDYEHRVADVWPEFGAHGKDRVTVRDVLVHAVGVPGLWPDITPADLGQWDRVCAFLAAQRPWWEPGTETGYHALTFGYVRSVHATTQRHRTH